MVDITETANKALLGMEGTVGHGFISARRLNNGRVLLKLNSEAAAAWLGDMDRKALFLGHFAPEAMVKARAFLQWSSSSHCGSSRETRQSYSGWRVTMTCHWAPC